jgi:hypothetical protein
LRGRRAGGRRAVGHNERDPQRAGCASRACRRCGSRVRAEHGGSFAAQNGMPGATLRLVTRARAQGRTSVVRSASSGRSCEPPHSPRKSSSRMLTTRLCRSNAAAASRSRYFVSTSSEFERAAPRKSDGSSPRGWHPGRSHSPCGRACRVRSRS